MKGFFWASVVGNALLAVSAYLLYTTNTSLNVTSGAQKATIAASVKTTEAYKQQVAQCVSEQKRLIVEHRNQIGAYQSASIRALELNKERLDSLLMERGRIEQALNRIKMPEVNKEPSERLAAIDRMIDAYIADLRR